MALKVSLCALLLGASLAAHADTRVHTVPRVQLLSIHEDFSDFSAGRVAIDGDFAILIEDWGTQRLAYLYQRDATGQWTARQTLLAVPSPNTLPVDDDVKMANGIAALRIGTALHIFERSGQAYVESAVAGTPTGAPGMAISGSSILVARRGCNYDADLYEKAASGTWSVTGQIRGAVGECNDHGAPLDLDGNVALVRNSPTEIREYRRSGTALAWVQVATIMPPAGATTLLGEPTLSGNVAFTSEGRYFERSGSSWVLRGRVQPLDSSLGTVPYGADYRGGLLITESVVNHYRAEPEAYLYLRNSAGNFAHVAVLESNGAEYVDVSGNRAVVSSLGVFGEITVSFYELPNPLIAPAAIANDFDARDISGWQQEPGSQFALANTARGVQYRQSSLADKATAFLTDSDWFNAQSIEADIIPRAINGSSWVGLALRYIDANSQYYVTLRNNGRLQLKRNVAGVFTTLDDVALPFTLNKAYHVKFTVNGSRLEVSVNEQIALSANDNALAHGRAALMTFRARADYDNVYAGTTRPFLLDFHDFSDPFDGSQPLTEQGGTWTLVEQSGDPDVAFGQTDNKADARAYVGTRTGDQVVESQARIDSYDPSTGGWVGLLARWVDSQTYYYMAVRSSGRLDIRKRAQGTNTVLATVPFTLPLGEYHQFKFVVVGDQLHAYVDGAFIAGAIDDEIPRGRYGIGTSHAAATFQSFDVQQP